MDDTDRWRAGPVPDRVVDAALVVVALAVWSVVVGQRWQDPPAVPVWVLHLDHVAGVLGCLSLWWRRRHPVVLTAFLATAGIVVTPLSVPSLIALCTVADRCSGRATAVLTALSLAATAAGRLTPLGQGPEISLPLEVLSTLSVHAVAVVWGLLVRSRRELIASLHERAAAAETEARLRAERAQHEARESLARDMHDVLGHRLSLLSVTAGALTRHRDATPEEIDRAAEAVRGNSHRALQDLREVIGVLRAPDGEVVQPGVADVVELVDEAARHGTPVRLYDDHGLSSGRHDLPTSLGRTLYRCVQEGLTNTRKHAPGAPVVVRITGEPAGSVELEIVNEAPSGPRQTCAPGSGAGLRGLAERAAIVGGELGYGPAEGGGWRLTVRLPWPV